MIVSLPRPLTSAEGEKCLADKSVLAGFKATTPPRPAAATPVFDKNDAPRSLSAYKGQGLIVNFWATWCAPCVREMPQLDRAREVLKGAGIDVLALSEDRAGAPLVEKFYKTNAIRNLEILIDKGGKVLRESKVRGLPTTLLIDAKGLEVGRVLGIAEWDSPKAIAFLKRCLTPQKSKKMGNILKTGAQR
ncbi:MAG: TlpA disulfide reductase family protein [Rhodospirillales bacterium]